MNVDFLTPSAGLVALAAVIPLAAWLVAEQRAAQARSVLRLAPPRRGTRALVPAALALAGGLLALAAAQPVLASRHASSVRRGGDVFVVLDTSRSMLAAPAPSAPNRFVRARAIARRLAAEAPSADVGLASLTDRVLPHLFPAGSRADFDATLEEAIGVERPPPASAEIGPRLGRATSLGALADLATARFFAASPRPRVAVVLTDGESKPFDPDPVRRALARARVQLVLVRVWVPGDRVWTSGGTPASDYRPDPASGIVLDELAAGVGGRALDEGQVGEAIAEVRRLAGPAGNGERRETTSDRRLAPVAAAAALIPLGLVLWRRNL